MDDIMINEVLEKLIGHIEATGETNYDTTSYENLEKLCLVLDKQIYKINELIPYSNRHEGSMCIIGIRAERFMQDIRSYNND